MADRAAAWLRGAGGAGPPGAARRSRTGLCAGGGPARAGSLLVPTSRELEDRETRDGIVWQVLPA